MSRKYNTERGGKKAKGWGKSGGMSKHRKSGISYNRKNALERENEANRRIEKRRSLRKKRRGKMVDSVRKLIKGYD